MVDIWRISSVEYGAAKVVSTVHSNQFISVLCLIISDIRCLLGELNCNCYWVPRSYNMVAHFFAKHGL